ncbi:ornithine cyclodeaminase family protein [Halospeciosus flavus]|uniref:Ornithine cyclodeaminase family protein n=1 Tax=Halospeciosus flavus TaxID=3032283 RepID=A0ABD5Z4N9_9EURY|nr:ornithine cyclodeaminase family protein [Halospeciosus flavus]
MVRILSESDVADLLELDALLDVIADAVRKQDRGDVERPERPHFPVGVGLDADAPDEPLGTGLTMPAYLHGADYYATKLASVHPGNADRDRPTVNAQVAVTDAATGAPVAYVAGRRVTNARTGCIGGVSARALADPPVRVGVIGAGAQARWQTYAIAAALPVDGVRVFSPSESRFDCAADLRDAGIDAEAADSAADAVDGADVVVTATTAEEPVVADEAIAPDAAVVAVGAYQHGMQELEPETLRTASAVFADVPGEAAETGDATAAGFEAADLRPLSEALDEEPRGGRRVVLSVGSAVFDAATATHLYERAVEADVGRTVDL